MVGWVGVPPNLIPTNDFRGTVTFSAPPRKTGDISAHGDPAFIHQHVVDAWTLQHADEHTKPIAITFALAGLYLHCERGYTGKQVQRVHMLMARRKQTWPTFAFPCERGTMTV